MADPRNTPLFLARRGYRQRRLIDAARVLPVFGAILLLMPVLWDASGGDPPAPRLAERGAYLFAVWGLLVLGAAVLGRRLRDGAIPPDGASREPGATSGGAPAAAGPDAERSGQIGEP